MTGSDGVATIASNEPSVTVIVEVAAKEGVEPTDLTPPLHDVVDPDALDALCAGDGGVEVSFEYRGYRVEVRDDGTVGVEE